MVWDFLKLVEPGRDEGVARVETILVVEWRTWSRRFWFRLGLLAGAHRPAQPTLEGVRSQAGSTNFGEGALAGRLNRLRVGSL